MNIHSKANNPFQFEQDLNNTEPSTIGRWEVEASLSDVYSHVGEKIGEIKSLLKESETSIIQYVVFQFDPVLGFGEKHRFLPWSKFNIQNLERVIFIPMGINTLADAPSFHQNRWPENIEEYLHDVKEYWRSNEQTPTPMPL